jgi:hypothetical protein
VVGILITVVMWPLSLWGHAIHLTPSWDQLMNRDKEWMHDHYPLVGLRYVGAAVLLAFAVGLVSLPFWGVIERRAAERQRQAVLAHQGWLESPPPPLQLPARFTQSWIEENVPYLHPGQVPGLGSVVKSDGATPARRLRPAGVRPFWAAGRICGPKAR